MAFSKGARPVLFQWRGPISFRPKELGEHGTVCAGSYLPGDFNVRIMPTPLATFSLAALCVTGARCSRSLVLWIKRKPLAINHLAVLSDRHVDARAAFGIDQLDSLRH
jgi:hypothetical protein